jgi:hypothetical protein
LIRASYYHPRWHCAVRYHLRKHLNLPAFDWLPNFATFRLMQPHPALTTKTQTQTKTSGGEHMNTFDV